MTLGGINSVIIETNLWRHFALFKATPCLLDEFPPCEKAIARWCISLDSRMKAHISVFVTYLVTKSSKFPALGLLDVRKLHGAKIEDRTNRLMSFND